MSDLRRIRPPAEYEGRGELIEKLTEEGLFESKQTVMMFAAAVGNLLGQDEQLAKKMGEGIRWQIFENNGDDVFINALALAETNSIQVLGELRDDEQGREAIFERYAARGLRIIEERVLKTPGDMLDHLLELIAEGTRRTGKDEGDGHGELSVEDLEFLSGGS